ncbi:MAG: aminotransferase class I/II [Candidatus Entotheonella factor]|uniref:Aminotransferase class I/II n=1 Tax=Entotheonella factor TaxID=1429438 RepID=W4LZ36_ENTF1|nr:aminotransferase class I/II-fold pyridoxal phosphate-dependent enzyme [Candidatus Entotheonella palauensis]ETX02642.1 MAG: aminotransferase class I/II [Candidatus Entotheonella factor]
MLDFTSALYLGLHHPSTSLRPWTQLTSGKPAALEALGEERCIAQSLAILVGCERAVLGPSTLHLFWDLFGVLAKHEIAVYLDAGAYPIARWGVERASAHGVPVHRFAHHDAAALARQLHRDGSHRSKPVVVADGFCPGCGRSAPIARYLDCIRSRGGYLVLDDTQALGVLGRSRDLQARYGQGGGGSLRWHQVHGPNVIVVSSLAKGFGVPVAVLAGSHPLVKHFKSKSETRVHTSPPSSAVLHAAERALAINQERGDVLRSRLERLVRQFRKRLAACGLSTTGGLFPVQTLSPMPDSDARLVHQRLLDLRVRAVLHRPRCKRGAAISFLITALHRFADIERAARVIAEAVRHVRIQSGKILENNHEYSGIGFGIV